MEKNSKTTSSQFYNILSFALLGWDSQSSRITVFSSSRVLLEKCQQQCAEVMCSVVHREGAQICFGQAHFLGKALARNRWMWGVLVVLGIEGVGVLPRKVPGINCGDAVM